MLTSYSRDKTPRGIFTCINNDSSTFCTQRIASSSENAAASKRQRTKVKLATIERKRMLIVFKMFRCLLHSTCQTSNSKPRPAKRRICLNLICNDNFASKKSFRSLLKRRLRRCGVQVTHQTLQLQNGKFGRLGIQILLR